MVANDWLDGSYQEVLSQHHPGQGRYAPPVQAFLLPRRDPLPRGAGDARLLNEGGEGLQPCPRFGAVLDDPELIAACVVGDGEAETGRWPPVAAQQVISAKRTEPCCPSCTERLQDRKSHGAGTHPPGELESFFIGCGWKPRFVAGSDPMENAPENGRRHDDCVRSCWRSGAEPERGGDGPAGLSMIVLRTPKGWTGPREGTAICGGLLARPSGARAADSPAHIRSSRTGSAATGPGELFDENGSACGLDHGADAGGGAAHGREPPRQRRQAPA
jgi:xylulose-5-phosphate/fructose-6-phosphate phosphoketolase